MPKAPSKIVTHLWFNTEAREAAQYYATVFPDSHVTSTTVLHGTPSGDVDVVGFEILGAEFMAISAGPLFTFNPSISFHVNCETAAEVDAIWSKLFEGGKVLMELGAYPFSERYGWIQDKYGLSWQIIAMGDRMPAQRITPVLMFVGAVAGKAEEAITLYTSVFRNAKIGSILRYGANAAPDKEGTIQFASFTLEGQEFGAMDSAHDHRFAFNEAISFMVRCADQKEIDSYWDALSADPAAEQCGWLKDAFGVSWQIVPIEMNAMMQDKDPSKVRRVTEAFLKMKKFDLAALHNAFDGR